MLVRERAGALLVCSEVGDGQASVFLELQLVSELPARRAVAFACLSSAAHSVPGPACCLAAQSPSRTSPRVDSDVGNTDLLLLERREDNGALPQLCEGLTAFSPQREIL